MAGKAVACGIVALAIGALAAYFLFATFFFRIPSVAEIVMATVLGFFPAYVLGAIGGRVQVKVLAWLAPAVVLVVAVFFLVIERGRVGTTIAAYVLAGAAIAGGVVLGARINDAAGRGSRVMLIAMIAGTIGIPTTLFFKV